jgi:putative spermidine/putrescine transport system permease protein
MDLDYDDLGKVIEKPEEKQIYVTLFIRTLWISLLVTLLTLIIGYPIAYLISTTPPKISNLLIIMVLLPFWTSLLVRTTSWIVLLQTQGVLLRYDAQPDHNIVQHTLGLQQHDPGGRSHQQ